jgi:hypothetical protein
MKEKYSNLVVRLNGKYTVGIVFVQRLIPHKRDDKSRRASLEVGLCGIVGG